VWPTKILAFAKGNSATPVIGSEIPVECADEVALHVSVRADRSSAVYPPSAVRNSMEVTA
jgi:hypothetical protein